MIGTQYGESNNRKRLISLVTLLLYNDASTQNWAKEDRFSGRKATKNKHRRQISCTRS